jgi:mono/diheme cytochrome c family protein
VLLALTGYEAALLAVAAVFIAFALIVALVIPRSRPEFPGRRLGIFLAICVALFACQITAVLLLAEVGEADEPAREEATPTETTATETTSTETTATDSTATETTEPTEGTGDPTAGKEVFVTVASPSCGGCHTLSDAGASGSVGPNLDATKPSVATVGDRVTNGLGVMPSFKDSLTEQQIQDVAAYVSSVAGS